MITEKDKQAYHRRVAVPITEDRWKEIDRLWANIQPGDLVFLGSQVNSRYPWVKVASVEGIFAGLVKFETVEGITYNSYRWTLVRKMEWYEIESEYKQLLEAIEVLKPHLT